MKNILLVLGAVATFALTGCSGTSTDDGATQSADEGALRTSAAPSAAKTIKSAVGVYVGGDSKRTHEIAISAAPAAVSAKLQSAYTDVVGVLVDENSFDEKDLDKGVFEIYKTAKNKTVIGYAVWAHGDNGDSGRGLVRGFDLVGKKIVDEDEAWSED